uniref:C2H2-type domain-containing protein n=1 Tax=Plectus sambesii TaxID=2011161 RepID=A0A914WXG7_9BILA
MCAECGVPKTELDLLEQHIKQEHLDDWQPFSCGYCDKRRFTEWQIREHIICHHPHQEVLIMFTDDEAKSMTLSDIVRRSMEKSERHRARRSAPRVFVAPQRESGGDAENGEGSADRQALITSNTVDEGKRKKKIAKDDEKDENVMLIDGKCDGKGNSGAFGGEQCGCVEEVKDGSVADDSRRQSTTVANGSTMKKLIHPANRSAPASAPPKRRASTTDSHNPSPIEGQTSSQKKNRRKTIHAGVIDTGDKQRKGEWFTVAGKSSRWWRCKQCDNVVCVRTMHVLQKHLSLPVFRCPADNCDYSSHYSIGMVRQHIKSHHRGKQLQPADDSAIYRKEINEVYAKCFS